MVVFLLEIFDSVFNVSVLSENIFRKIAYQVFFIIENIISEFLKL